MQEGMFMNSGMQLREEIFGSERTEQEALQMIRETPGMYANYMRLSERLKQEVLDFCMGKCGLNLTYDPMFKAIFNPQQFPSRLEDFLSLCLGEEIKILNALPTESSRLTEEGSLLVMDLLVRLQSGALANVEIQRIGYLFPGQRCACYSSDLVMRQYSQVRDQCRRENKTFSYRQIQKVYTIVLFQDSPEEFHQFPGQYLHYAKQQFNTGLELDMIQEYLLIPLDIFLESQHNISNRLDAWLTVIASSDPERILDVVRVYPEFGELYRQVFRFRDDIKELMSMFSEALKILDTNTTKYMIEEQKEKLRKQEEEIRKQREEIKSQQEELLSAKAALAEKDSENQRLKALLAAKE